MKMQKKLMERFVSGELKFSYGDKVTVHNENSENEEGIIVGMCSVPFMPQGYCVQKLDKDPAVIHIHPAQQLTGVNNNERT